MEKRRGIVGPLILIAIGVLFLLANLGYLSTSVWLIAIQFWPVILILAGLEIIFGRTRWGQILVLLVSLLALGGVIWISLNPGALNVSGPQNSKTINESREGVTAARVELGSGVGNLTITALDPASPNWVQGTITYPNGRQVNQSYQVVDGTAQLQIESQGGGNVFGNQVETWNIGLVPGLPIELKVDGGVGSSDLDLNALGIRNLDVDTGVGGVRAVMPSHGGLVNASVDGGIGGLTIQIPQGVPARIVVNTGIGGADVNQARFPRVGDDTYESPDYAAATDKINLYVNAGIGGISIP